MPKIVLLLLVVLVGMLQPVQAGMNAEFRRHAAHPLQAGAVNMTVGAVLVLTVLLVSGLGLPARGAFQAAPWWSYGGGVIGASIVIIMLIGAPKLGAALLVAGFVAGQLTSSVAIDHLGLVGYAERPASTIRVVGIVLLGLGVLLIERGG